MESLLEAANKCDRNQVSFNYVKLISLLISGLISNIFARKLKKTLAYCSIGCPVTPAVRARGSFFSSCAVFSSLIEYNNIYIFEKEKYLVAYDLLAGINVEWKVYN